MAELLTLEDAARRLGAQVDVRVGFGKDGVRGLFPARDCGPHHVLLRAPSTMAFPMPFTDSAFAAPWLLREVLALRRRQRQAQLAPPPQQRCSQCGQELWQPRLTAEFISSLPGPGDLVTGYCWPEQAIPLLACPELERVVRALKGRALRVYRTGLCCRAQAHACTAGARAAPGAPPPAPCPACPSALTAAWGAPFPLTLAQAELQANGLCPRCEGAPPQPRPREQEAEQAGLVRASLQDVEWAASVICSRTFHSSVETSQVMMPLLDMINHEEQDCGANAFVWSSSSSEAGDAAALPSPGQQVDVAAQQPPAEPGCEKADELPQLPVEHLEQSLAGLSLAAATSDVATPAPPPAAPAPPLWHGGGGGGGGGGACSCHQPLTDWARGWRRHVTLRSKVPLRAGQQLYITYHNALRDDEALVYYGMLLGPDGPPAGAAATAAAAAGALPSSGRQRWVCAVDHHEFAPRWRPCRGGGGQGGSLAGGDLEDVFVAGVGSEGEGSDDEEEEEEEEEESVDEEGSSEEEEESGEQPDRTAASASGQSQRAQQPRERVLAVDPLDGPWRSVWAPFAGTKPELRKEVRRLAGRIADLQQRNADLAGAAAAAAAAAEACTQAGMPWLPGFLARFRRRRAGALQAEMRRLQQLQFTDDKQAAAGGRRHGQQRPGAHHHNPRRF